MLPSRTVTCQPLTAVPSWKARMWRMTSSLPAKSHSLGRSNHLPQGREVASALRSPWRPGEDISPRTLRPHDCLGTTVLLPTLHTLTYPPALRIWLLSSVFSHKYFFPLRPRTALHKAPSLPTCTQWMGCLGLLTSRRRTEPLCGSESPSIPQNQTKQ